MPHCLDQISQLDEDKVFWELVKLKKEIIPDLLNLIDDTTKLKANVRWFSGKWTVGDAAYRVIQEIIYDIPTFELMNTNFNDGDCGYCAYWQHLRLDYSNRLKFKLNLTNWYQTNKSNLVWNKSDDISECMYTNPNKGFYVIKK